MTSYLTRYGILVFNNLSGTVNNEQNPATLVFRGTLSLTSEGVLMALSHSPFANSLGFEAQVELEQGKTNSTKPKARLLPIFLILFQCYVYYSYYQYWSSALLLSKTKTAAFIRILI